MKKHLTLIALVFVSALNLTACSSMSQQDKQLVGTGVGAVAGGVIGDAVFGSTLGTVAGAAAGGIAGNIVGGKS